MEKFTVSEVRDIALIAKAQGQLIMWSMLRAYADRLKEDEKAVPFGYAYRYWDGIRFDTGGREINGSKPTATIPLYTHPSPADAEKLQPPSSLQEALCVLENAALHGLVLHGDDIPRLRATVNKIAPGQTSADTERLAEALARISLIERNRSTSDTNRIDAVGRIAREALASHSAQAQPPAARVSDIDNMVTRFLGWRLPQDFAPDAGISFKPMPDEYMPHCWPIGTNLLDARQAREMIEYMLAAQENPNG